MTVTSKLVLADFDPAVTPSINTVTSGDQLGSEIIALSDATGFMLAYRSVGGTDTVPVLEYVSTANYHFVVDLGLSGQIDMVGDPDFIRLANGDIVVAWAEAGTSTSGAGNGDIYRVIIDGADFSVKVTKSYIPSTSFGATDPELTALSGGNWVAVYDNGNGFAGFQLMDANGVQIGTEVTISTNTTSERDPVVTALAGGGFVVTYTETVAGDINVTAAVFNDAGVQQGGFVDVSGGVTPGAFNEQSQPTIAALQNGGFAVAMLDATPGTGAHILLKSFDASGTHTASNAIGLATVAGDPDIKVLPNGLLLVTWTSNDGVSQEIRGAVFDTDLNPVATSLNEGQALTDFVIADVAGDEGDSSAAIDPTGWLSVSFAAPNDGDGTGIGLYQGNFYNKHTSDGSGDTVIGDALTDIATMGAGDDTVLGRGGNDQLFGQAGADTLMGEDGDDFLTGGADGDTLIGGDGIDSLSYSGSTSGVTINLASLTASGGDADGDVLAGIENVTGSSEGDVLTGDANVNTLSGGSGSDILSGGLGQDTLNGGSGNDTFVLGSETDAVTDTGGIDTETTTVSRTLVSRPFIENLTLLGTLAIDGTGNLNANTITGNGNNNTLDGGADSATDTLIGLLGNDTYVLGSGGDLVQDTGGTGDTITTTVSRSLATYLTIENLALLGAAATGTGNASANLITGNGSANTLSGMMGNDTLSGDAGIDTLIGGVGRDTMTGGAGQKDIFKFVAIGESGITATTRDIITDFVHLTDKVDLFGIDAKTSGAGSGGNNAFSAVLVHGTVATAFTAQGQIIWYQENLAGTANDKTIIRLNVDADAANDMTIQLKGLINLSAADFVL